MDALMLDGNAAGGILREVFSLEMTTAVGTCNECGRSEAVGAVRLYKGAGVVLRCPHCENVLMKIVTDRGRVWIDLRGLRTIELEP